MKEFPKEIYVELASDDTWWPTEEKVFEQVAEDADDECTIGKYVFVSKKEYEWKFVEKKPAAKTKKK